MARTRLAVVVLAGVVSTLATVGLALGELDGEAASRAWVASLVAALLAADVKLGAGGGGGSAVLLAAGARAALLMGSAESAGLIVGMLTGSHT